MENVNQSSPKPVGLREKIERFIDEALGPVGTNIAGLTEQVGQLKADLEHCHNLLVEARRDKEHYYQQAVKLQATVQRQDERIAEIARSSTVKSSLAAKDRKISRQAAEINRMLTKLVKADADLKRFKACNNELDSIAGRAKQRLGEVQHERNRLAEENEKLQATCKDLRQQNASLQDRINFATTATTPNCLTDEEEQKIAFRYMEKLKQKGTYSIVLPADFSLSIEDQTKQERLDMFAAAALSGSIAADGGQNFESEAKMAYSYAEAMEEERAKRLKT